MLTIGIIGTRGIPNRHGGFERFVELLLTHEGWDGSNYRFRVYGEGADGAYNGWTDLVSVGLTKNDHPLAYYFRSVVRSTRDCDVTLCCGVGLSILSFWPRLFGKALIVNPDGCEWRRSKWSSLGRWAIRAMYAPALIGANKVVIDAEALREDFAVGQKARYIPYPAPTPVVLELGEETRDRFSVARPYVLVIARLEPENNLEMILDAFDQVGDVGVDLLIVGGLETPHYQNVLAKRERPNIRFVGSVYDQDELDALRSNCLAYFHGHSVGGTNPSLLEALASVRSVIFCHRNKYNEEVAGGQAHYVSEPAELAHCLHQAVTEMRAGNARKRSPTRDIRFHPDTIFRQYMEMFGETHAAR